MNARTVGVAAALSSLVALAPAEVRAQGSGADLSGLAAIATVGMVLGGGIVIGGVITDVMVLHDLAGGQGVRRGPAIAGTTLWGIASAVMIPLTVVWMSSDTVDAGAVAGLLLSDAVVVGSLALSIYGLTRPPPAPAAVVPWSRRLILHPTAVATTRGIVPGAGLTLTL